MKLLGKVVRVALILGGVIVLGRMVMDVTGNDRSWHPVLEEAGDR